MPRRLDWRPSKPAAGAAAQPAPELCKLEVECKAWNLHPTACNLHPTRDTRHLTPCTLHPAPPQDPAPQEHVVLAPTAALRVPPRFCARRSLAVSGGHATRPCPEPASAGGFFNADCATVTSFPRPAESIIGPFMQTFFVNKRGNPFSPAGLSTYYAHM